MNTSKNKIKNTRIILVILAFSILFLINSISATQENCNEASNLLNSIYSNINSGSDFFTLNQAKTSAFCNNNDLLLAGAGTMAQCSDSSTLACNYNTNYEFNGPVSPNGWQSFYSAEEQNRFYDNVREEAICLPQKNSSDYFSVYIRTAGTGSDKYSLDQSNTIAICDVGDKVISGGGYAPYCDSNNPACGKKQYLELNSPVTFGSQEGWQTNYDLGGNEIYDTVQTFAICLKKTNLFDDNFKIYNVINEGNNFYDLDQNKTAAFCSPGDIAIGGGGNAPLCDNNSNIACGRTQYLEFNGKIISGDKEGWQTYFDLTGNSIYDTQKTSVICLGLADNCINETNITCSNNSDCGTNAFIGNPLCSNKDVFQNFITHKCVNPGQTNSYCINSSVSQLKQDCGEGSCGNYTNICKNNNVYKTRTCATKGCSNGTCFSTNSTEEQILEICSNGCTNGSCNLPSNITCSNNSQCGTNGFIGNPLCSNNDVFQNFITYTCVNPGQTNSYCSNSTANQFKQDCGNNSCGNFTNICKNNNVYKTRTCATKGCSNGTCFSTNSTEEQIVEICYNRCTNGTCNSSNITCTNNSECGTNGFIGNPLCSNYDVFQNFITFTCVNPGQTNSYCTNLSASQLNEDCGEDSCETYGNNYCVGKKVYKKRTCYDKGCSNNYCFNTQSTQETFIEECDNKCVNGTCKDGGYVPCSAGECLIDNKPSISQDQEISYAFINDTIQKLEKKQVKCNYFFCNTNTAYTNWLWILVIIFLLLLIILIIAFILWLLGSGNKREKIVAVKSVSNKTFY